MREICTGGNYKYVISAYDEPIARVKPGEVVTFFTEDAFEGAVKTEDDLPCKVRGPWEIPRSDPSISRAPLLGIPWRFIF